MLKGIIRETDPGSTTFSKEHVNSHSENGKAGPAIPPTSPRKPIPSELWRPLLAPGPEVKSVEHDAEQVGWNKAQLRCPHTDDTDDCAVHTRQNPTLPASPSDQNG